MEMANRDQAAPTRLEQADVVVGSRNLRRWRKFFFKPKFQVRYGYYQIFSGLGFFSITVYLVNEKLVEIDHLLKNNAIFDTLTRKQMQDAYASIAEIAMAGFAGYLLFTFAYSLLLSHRISGPTISIVTFIDELNKGNYGFRRGLRNGDELMPIMDALHDLSKTLFRKSRNPSEENEQ